MIRLETKVREDKLHLFYYLQANLTKSFYLGAPFPLKVVKSINKNVVVDMSVIHGCNDPYPCHHP